MQDGSATLGTSRIRALRPPKRAPDAWVPIAVTSEYERTGTNRLSPSVTVFLAGSECPFSCVFCDLWQQTLEGPTPPGAIPAQLDAALRDLPFAPADTTLKLYNASNFFDPRAVPRADWEAIADRVAHFGRITVECHPRFVDARIEEFRRLVDGRLEVAIGLETVHPQALGRLNKQMTLSDFDRAADLLRDEAFDLRVFALVGAPWVPAGEATEWLARTVAYAFEKGARVVSLIPIRPGNGALEELAATGAFVRPTLQSFESAVDRCLRDARGVVLADLWDVERLSAAACCAEARIERLERMNRSGAVEPPIDCRRCHD